MPKRYNKKAVERMRRKMRENNNASPPNRKKQPMSDLERMVADMLDDFG